MDKLQLIDYLLESLDMPDTEIEKLWAEESSRRWEGYKAGEIGSVSAAEVFEKYKPCIFRGCGRAPRRLFLLRLREPRLHQVRPHGRAGR
nr:addiction module protein [Geobacter hydrogenophilus]